MINKQYKLYVVFFSILVFFQITTTNIKYAYTFDAAQIDLQQTRMNTYPYPFGKLGYVLEAKREVQIVSRLIDNFFTVVDFREYFPSKMPYLLSPLVFIGLYQFIDKRNKHQLVYRSFIFSIVLLTFIGPYAKYGPVLMFVYLYYFVWLGTKQLIGKK